MTYSRTVRLHPASRPKQHHRALVIEALERRETMDADPTFGPPPALAESGRTLEVNWAELRLVDDARRALTDGPRLVTRLANQAADGAETVVVNGGQAAAGIGSAATEVVNGGQTAARAAETVVVNGGQAAAGIGSAATEVVDGGQTAARVASPLENLPRVVQSPEFDEAFRAHLEACRRGDTTEALSTLKQMKAEELLEFPDGSCVYLQSGAPYTPAAKTAEALETAAEVVETAAEAGSAGRRLAGKLLTVIGTIADFTADPVIGTIFYDENLAAGEAVFGTDTYLSEVYANLQCVPALGGPLADVGADLYTILHTDWSALIFGADDGPGIEERKAAIERYRDLENRKDYDANHGNQYQAALWNEVLKVKAELRSMGIDPDKVR